MSGSNSIGDSVDIALKSNMLLVPPVVTPKHILYMISMLLAWRVTMMNEKPQLNTWIGDSKLVAAVDGGLDRANEMLVAVSVKDTPDFIKTRIAVGDLNFNLLSCQLDDLVRGPSFSAEPNLHGWITDVARELIDVFLFCCAFADHEQAFAGRLRAVAACKTARAIPRLTWHQQRPQPCWSEGARMT
jgi:hypothetical protein